jgi:hypothetical protein
MASADRFRAIRLGRDHAWGLGDNARMDKRGRRARATDHRGARRAGHALGEIVSQADEFISYFMNLLTATPAAYPATFRLMNVASLIGLYGAMHLKGQFQRPRPSQLCPALMPPIAVPGHASYPSGHSTQAHLIALCMSEVFQGVNAAPRDADLLALADRIARNREIAGLHYQSDTWGELQLAQQMHAQLSGAGGRRDTRLP